MILGIDFMQEHGIVLDFATNPIRITQQAVADYTLSRHDRDVLSAAIKTKVKFVQFRRSLSCQKRPWIFVQYHY